MMAKIDELGLYKVQIKNPKLSINTAWHRRLGHCGEEKLRKFGLNEKIASCCLDVCTAIFVDFFQLDIMVLNILGLLLMRKRDFVESLY